MICLVCEAEQEAPNPEECVSCKRSFQQVKGIYGTNHVTQLIQCIEELEAGQSTIEDTLHQYDTFLNRWDEFNEAWPIDSESLLEIAASSSLVQYEFRSIIEQVTSARESLQKLTDHFEQLADEGRTDLAQARQLVYEFSVTTCQASGRFFDQARKFRNPDDQGLSKNLSAAWGDG